MNEMKFREAVELIDSELFRISNQACANLAKWGPQKVEHLALAISEQSGKLSQQLLHSETEPEKYSKGGIIQQARHTAALCLQMAVSLEGSDK